MAAASLLGAACLGPFAPAAPSGPVTRPCELEPAIAAFADRRGSLACGDDASNGGECDLACGERIRSCVLAAAAAARPFTAVWSKASRDGVGTRHAIVGRRAGRDYQMRWYDYRFASGHPRHGGDGNDTELWTARACGRLEDLSRWCPLAGEPRGDADDFPGCDVDRSTRAYRLELDCVDDRLVAGCTD